ncbi:DUF1329 domain-containing protein [Pseudomonas sp. MPC6]|jgi:hypothetical protein|uniref:DUF1329 domain-containing protein n=1 Tax=unclassified Pseudomonas TaxID=196821 RepID=UPI001110093F|nr:DUF1329 domain-containing protein [Pseudomonas sp. MPC6]QCY13278.1 DUF1329 domain-containing protein [Pseudomonas sp. MPC6]
MHKNKITQLLACLTLSLSASVTHAAVSGAEAQVLKSALTPLGAERAGNADGSIPAWTGGYTQVPAGFQEGHRAFDPFKDDKPLYSVTAANMSQYADKLTDGVKQLLKDNPQTFKLDVYPTRRTAAAPQWVYDNTFKNATQATLEADGLVVKGAYGGVPFPIPKNGNEVMWNHQTLWRGEATHSKYKVWTTTTDGQRVLATAAIDEGQYPFYYKELTAETAPNPNYMLAIQLTYAPAFRAGEALMVHNVTDYVKGRTLWQYLAGQRRVRRAPSINFDTPNAVASGVNFVDETFGGAGSPERYDWKLIGKKELLIPYNNNALLSHGDEEVMDKRHVKPAFMRWELHRVWVVEATLKPGKRHAVPKRMFYYDEDNWGNASIDGWDAEGTLWRTALTTPFAAPDIPATVNYCTGFFHDHRTKAWIYNCALGDAGNEQYQIVERRRESFFAPESLTKMSAR